MDIEHAKRRDCALEIRAETLDMFDGWLFAIELVPRLPAVEAVVMAVASEHLEHELTGDCEITHALTDTLIDRAFADIGPADREYVTERVSDVVKPQSRNEVLIIADALAVRRAREKMLPLVRLGALLARVRCALGDEASTFPSKHDIDFFSLERVHGGEFWFNRYGDIEQRGVSLQNDDGAPAPSDPAAAPPCPPAAEAPTGSAAALAVMIRDGMVDEDSPLGQALSEVLDEATQTEGWKWRALRAERLLRERRCDDLVEGSKAVDPDTTDVLAQRSDWCKDECALQRAAAEDAAERARGDDVPTVGGTVGERMAMEDESKRRRQR